MLTGIFEEKKITDWWERACEQQMTEHFLKQTKDYQLSDSGGSIKHTHTHTHTHLQRKWYQDKPQQDCQKSKTKKAFYI